MKKKWLAVSFLVFTLLTLPVFRFVPNVNANPDWLSGWQYRKSHVINSASGAGTNYQVKVKVYYKDVWKRYGVRNKTFVNFETALLRLGKDYCRKMKCSTCGLHDVCQKN